MRFKKGHIPWNKNIKLTEKHRERISKSRRGQVSPMRGKTKTNGLYPRQCGFSMGHPHYTTRGDFKGGNVPWNAETSIWVEVKCLICEKVFKIRKQQFERGRGKYCNRRCFIESQKQISLDKRQRLNKMCQQCRQFFEIRPHEKNKKFCSRTCVNKSKIGKKRLPFTEEHKRKIGKANSLVPHPRGKNHPCWKGGITPLVNQLRALEEYKQWRMTCLRRDWFRCQECFSKDNIEVHHIKSFRELVAEFLKEYDQFSPIEDRETLVRLAMKHEPFWDVNNGQTLCETHHKSLRRLACL
jgi:hypothetical protein